MIFVDANVFVYAVGGPHPHREPARRFLNAHAPIEGREEGASLLCTSSEVLQELLHIYLPKKRHRSLDRALEYTDLSIAMTWPMEPDDVRFARDLASAHPDLSARDLVHLASCRRRGVERIKTWDRALAAAFEPGPGP